MVDRSRAAAARRGVPPIAGLTLGATPSGAGRWTFRVWAPKARAVELVLADRTIALAREDRGYFAAGADGLHDGDRYRFRLDGSLLRPDPASRSQPDGVHGASALVDPAFAWTDAAFVAPPLRDLVVYQLHVGTFTPEGTFDAATRHFRELRDLGVNALEPLPIAQFPGTRNWGYDGAYPWSAQESYGGATGLRRFIDAAHASGLAVILDVVHNHLGPEGSYLGDYGRYLTARYETPWGPAMNFDGPDSDEVRRFFLESLLMQLREYHVDGFRIDAVHAIVDQSAHPYLAELADVVHAEARALGRAGYVIAESALNDARVIAPRDEHGWGHDAQWSDDFHHSVHALLTGEREGYYQDYGGIAHLATTLRDGWCYQGQYSTFRRRRYGNSPRGRGPEQLVVAIQDHDQIGNRARGDRLSTLVGSEELKVAAAALLLSPFTPMLFMGEEYGETRPFQFFTSHSEPALIQGVRLGRREEFKEFAWQGEVPDPQSEETFRASILDRSGGSAELRLLYRELLRLRATIPALRPLRPAPTAVVAGEAAIALVYDAVAVVLSFGAGSIELPAGPWEARLDTAEARFGGAGATWAGREGGHLAFSGARALLLVRA